MTMMNRAALLLPAMLVAALASGCTVNWGESGITDVLFGNRKAGDIAPKTPADAGAKDAIRTAEADKDDDDDEKSALRRIAVLPVAYRDATTASVCDLCPGDLAMKPTSRESARLVTGFIYEAVATHPRLLFPTPDVVDKAVAASGGSMRQAAAALAAQGKADYVIAAALLELRPRVGPDDAPERPAGAAVHASLVEAASGKVLWSKTFDRDEGGRGVIKRSYDKVMNDEPVRYSTAEGYSEHAVDELLEDLVDELP